MADLLYRLLNPPVKLLLRSGLHGMLSSNTLLLEFTGRKSGRALSTPISYYLRDGAAHCFTTRSFAWWHNLKAGKPVRLTIAGKQWQSTPELETDNDEFMRRELAAFLRAVPRDAPHAGVRLNPDGNPDESDIAAAIPSMVYLKFPLEQIS